MWYQSYSELYRMCHDKMGKAGEFKNAAIFSAEKCDAVPIKGSKCWIHIAHGVRNTAAGLRYVLYLFGTDLNDPAKVIAEPSGVFLVPLGKERVGDVSNVVFTNGAIARENGDVYIYYALSDTRLHVATTIDKLEDYLFHTPKDAGRSADCVKQRFALIDRNLALLNER